MAITALSCPALFQLRSTGRSRARRSTQTRWRARPCWRRRSSRRTTSPRCVTAATSTRPRALARQGHAGLVLAAGSTAGGGCGSVWLAGLSQVRAGAGGVDPASGPVASPRLFPGRGAVPWSALAASTPGLRGRAVWCGGLCARQLRPRGARGASGRRLTEEAAGRGQRAARREAWCPRPPRVPQRRCCFASARNSGRARASENVAVSVGPAALLCGILCALCP